MAGSIQSPSASRVAAIPVMPFWQLNYSKATRQVLTSYRKFDARQTFPIRSESPVCPRPRVRPLEVGRWGFGIRRWLSRGLGLAGWESRGQLRVKPLRSGSSASAANHRFFDGRPVAGTAPARIIAVGGGIGVWGARYGSPPCLAWGPWGEGVTQSDRISLVSAEAGKADGSRGLSPGRPGRGAAVFRCRSEGPGAWQ